MTRIWWQCFSCLFRGFHCQPNFTCQYKLGKRTQGIHCIYSLTIRSSENKGSWLLASPMERVMWRFPSMSEYFPVSDVSQSLGGWTQGTGIKVDVFVTELESCTYDTLGTTLFSAIHIKCHPLTILSFSLTSYLFLSSVFYLFYLKATLTDVLMFPTKCWKVGAPNKWITAFQ